ncbi:MAG: serine hydrolase [bacterium]|nr:MAG: serine hydrolase [bacterium]
MKRNLKLTITSVIILSILIFFVSQDYILAQTKSQKIDELMSLYHQYRQLNGSVLVAENGEIIFKKGYGFANMEWEIPNDTETRFRLGSITKQFTSMLIMQLVEKEKIKLDDKLSDYLPYYRKDIGEKVTIHHLLTHTSGIPSYTGLPGFFQDVSRDPYGIEEFIKKYCSGDLEFEPGSKYKYNNSGYFLLGAIIEKVTEKTYEQALKQNILDPLNMKNTGYDRHDPILPKRAAGYEKGFDGFINAPYLDMSLPYSAGAMYSTVEDLYLWDQALYTERLLSQKYKEIMFTPFLNNYAYGWGVRKIALEGSKDSLTTIAHGGGINGFNTLITRLIDDRHLIVLLNNTGGTNLGEMSQGITNILYDKSYDLPKKSIAEVLYKTILENDVEVAIKQYRELKGKQIDSYNFKENELNRLGYQLLRNKKINDAIEIFKLNVEAYPEAYNTYDSLGEACMKNGDKELAIKNYKKSLELNPDNTNAVKMLKNLEEK